MWYYRSWSHHKQWPDQVMIFISVWICYGIVIWVLLMQPDYYMRPIQCMTSHFAVILSIGKKELTNEHCHWCSVPGSWCRYGYTTPQFMFKIKSINVALQELITPLKLVWSSNDNHTCIDMLCHCYMSFIWGKTYVWRWWNTNEIPNKSWQDLHLDQKITQILVIQYTTSVSNWSNDNVVWQDMTCNLYIGVIWYSDQVRQEWIINYTTSWTLATP